MTVYRLHHQLQRVTRGQSFAMLRRYLGLEIEDVAARLRLPLAELKHYERGEHVADEAASRISCYHLKLLSQGECRHGFK